MNKNASSLRALYSAVMQSILRVNFFFLSKKIVFHWHNFKQFASKES